MNFYFFHNKTFFNKSTSQLTAGFIANYSKSAVIFLEQLEETFGFNIKHVKVKKIRFPNPPIVLV